MPDYEYLFTPIKIGPAEAKNRICCSAHADALAEGGMPVERQRRYYEEKARGGVGFMMCFGSASVHPSSPARDWASVELFDDRVIPYLKKFSETMHGYDVPVSCQITHKGRRGRTVDSFNPLYAPSDYAEPNHRETPHRLSKEKIEELIQAYADGAFRLKEGGFDGCEVMASHGHLIDQFWSLNVNDRTDEYGGGSFEDRMRFGVRVVEAIRKRCGKDFMVGIRMTGDDFRENGLNPEQTQQIAKRMSEMGELDYFNIIGGTAETFVGEAMAVPNMGFKLGTYTYLAALIREVVDAPVIATGRIVDPVQADRVLKEGQADLCIMNRALIADPHMPNKAREGRNDDVRQCMGYNEGCIDRIYTGRGVTCVQNPVISREAEWAEIEKAPEPHKIVVVGGGPAGLEAARVAAARGHKVTLYEKNDMVGGQTLIAKNAPGRQDFDGATRYSSLQCRKHGVTMRLNHEATVEEIVAEEADEVIVATGATPREPALEGRERHRWLAGWDVLAGRYDELGDTALVIDESYGHSGPTTAELLLDKGLEVDLLTAQETIASFLGDTTRPPLLKRLFTKGAQLFCHLEPRALRDGLLIARNIWSGQEMEVGPYDTFVYAFGGKADDRLVDPLKEKGVAVTLAGDCFAPRSLQHAIVDGHTVGRAC